MPTHRNRTCDTFTNMGVAIVPAVFTTTKNGSYHLLIRCRVNNINNQRMSANGPLWGLTFFCCVNFSLDFRWRMRWRANKWGQTRSGVGASLQRMIRQTADSHSTAAIKRLPHQCSRIRSCTKTLLFVCRLCLLLFCYESTLNIEHVVSEGTVVATWLHT